MLVCRQFNEWISEVGRGGIGLSELCHVLPGSINFVGVRGRHRCRESTTTIQTENYPRIQGRQMADKLQATNLLFRCVSSNNFSEVYVCRSP
jgi:hypothetical protein